MNQLTEAGKQLIKSFERLELEAYPDPASVLAIACRRHGISIYNAQYIKLGHEWRFLNGKPWTIGYGQTRPDIKAGSVWTPTVAENNFEKQVSYLANAVSHNLETRVKLKDNQFSALVSFAYNLGIGRLGELITKAALRKDHPESQQRLADLMLHYNHANGQVMPGLTKRREKEREMFLDV